MVLGFGAYECLGLRVEDLAFNPFIRMVDKLPTPNNVLWGAERHVTHRPGPFMGL